MQAEIVRRTGVSPPHLHAPWKGIGSKSITRREFLRIAELMFPGLALTACGMSNVGQEELPWPDLTEAKKSHFNPQFIEDKEWAELTYRERIVNIIQHKVPRGWQKINKTEDLAGKIVEETQRLSSFVCSEFLCDARIVPDTAVIYSMDDFKTKLTDTFYQGYTVEDWQQRLATNQAWVEYYQEGGQEKRKIVITLMDFIDYYRQYINQPPDNNQGATKPDETIRNRAIAQFTQDILQEFLHETLHAALNIKIPVPADKKQKACQYLQKLKFASGDKPLVLKEVLASRGFRLDFQTEESNTVKSLFLYLEEARHNLIYQNLLRRIFPDEGYVDYFIGQFCTERALFMEKFLDTIGISDVDWWFSVTCRLTFTDLVDWYIGQAKKAGYQINPQEMVYLFYGLSLASEKLFTPRNSYDEEVAATKRAGEEQWRLIKTWFIRRQE